MAASLVVAEDLLLLSNLLAISFALSLPDNFGFLLQFSENKSWHSLFPNFAPLSQSIQAPCKLFETYLKAPLISQPLESFGYRLKKVDKSYIFDFEINSKERRNIIEKASICINGISLTISKKTKKGFQIWVIPHTFKLTNLSKVKKGSLVNIEIDILSKYIKNFFHEKK